MRQLEQGPPVPSASPRVPLKCHPVNVTAAVSNGDTNWALLKLSRTRASHQAAVQGWQRLNSSASSPGVISTKEIQTSNPCNSRAGFNKELVPDFWCWAAKITELVVLGLMLSSILPAQVERAPKALQLHTGGWISVFSVAWYVLLGIAQITIKSLAHSCVAMGLCWKPGVPLPWVSFSGQNPFLCPLPAQAQWEGKPVQGCLFETKSSWFLQQDFKVSLMSKKFPAEKPSREGLQGGDTSGTFIFIPVEGRLGSVHFKKWSSCNLLGNNKKEQR